MNTERKSGAPDTEERSLGSDRRQDRLRDERGGARDNVVPRPAHPMEAHSTVHERAQHGADVRPETEAADEYVPEGLRRARKGPLNPHGGEGEPPKPIVRGKPERD
jgi:hypothetical protein